MAIQRDKVIASAEKLVAKGKIEAAIKEYERLLEDNPNDVNTLNRIGDLWVRINRNDEAVKVFTRIADHYSRDGFFLKAIAIYKKINKLDPSKLEIYAKLADLYAKQGLAMEAKSQYQVLADYYLKHGDPGNALAIYRKISELDPNSINVHVKLADLYSANNQTADALKEYDRVGRMLLKRGMLDEAVQVFRKALKIDAKNIELVESLVTALLEARNFDSAAQIVGAALESNHENPRLLALLGRVQLARGNTEGARTALERGLTADPNEPSIRENLADLHLKLGRPDPALEMLVPLVDKAVLRGERGAAVEMLNRVLRVDPGHTPTLERLVGVYMKVNEETNILASMNSLAEAHIARGSYEEAARVLERLIQREPQNAQHRTKLSFVRSQMGGVDTVPVRPKTAEVPMPSMEIEEPPPSFDIVTESPSFELGLDSSPGLELDLSAEPAVSAPRPAPQAAPPSPAQAGDEDDLDFITEHLTEAEVFAKYGLSEKAVEHLRAVIERAPKNPAAHDRLFRLLLDEGEIDAARIAATQYVALLREKGDDSAIDAVRNEFLVRGQSLPEGGAPAAPPVVTVSQPVPTALDESWLETEAPAEAGPAFEVADEEISFDLEQPADFAVGMDLESAPPAAEEAPPALPAEEEISFAEDLQPAAEVEQELAQEELTIEQPSEEITLDEGSLEELTLEEPAAAESLLAEPAAAEPAAEADEAAWFEGVLPEDVEPVAELPVPQEPLAEEPAVGELFFEDSLLEESLLEEPVAEEPLVEEPLVEEPLVEEPQFDELLAEEPAETSGAAEGPLFEEPMQQEPSIEPSLASHEGFSAETLAGAELPFEQLSGEGEGEQPFFGVEGLGAELLADIPTSEEVGEIDFYISQELFDDARDRVESLLARFPGDPGLESRRQRIEAAVARHAPEPSAPAAPLAAAPALSSAPHVLSRDEIETELLSALPDDDDFATVPAPPPAAQPAPPPPPPAALHEDNLFADEDDFFDLAAELESELGGEEEPIALSEEEQSLEQIFKEFKKGVEQQLDSEDYDTHYNLGIAYKEMGLIDEAIGEFQLASKDPKRSVECASMLGLCFLEKGMPQLAIKWYRKGLEIPEITEEEHVGLLYDLGSAYMEVGDTPNAQKAFMEVYGMNTNYRDIVNRIKQLEGAR